MAMKLQINSRYMQSEFGTDQLELCSFWNYTEACDVWEVPAIEKARAC